MTTGRTSRLLLAAACLLTLSGAHADRPHTRAAIVLLSKEAEPFRKCEKAAAAALAARGWSVTSAVLDPKDAPQTGDAAVIAVGTEAAAAVRAARSANAVFCMVADAEGAGLLADPALSGVLAEVPFPRQVAVIARAVPAARTIGLIVRSNSARNDRALASLKSAAAAAGLAVVTETVESREEMSGALDRLLKRNIDVYWTIPDGSLYDANTIKAVLSATLDARVPVFGFSAAMVRAGALIGVAITPEAQGRQAAALLNARTEAHPARSETVEPEFEISVNKVVAERLGVRLPQDIANGKGD